MENINNWIYQVEEKYEDGGQDWENITLKTLIKMDWGVGKGGSFL